MSALTLRYDRVRALHWCPNCFWQKPAGELVCQRCDVRLRRNYGSESPMRRIIPQLDIYLANHKEHEAISWLGGA